jgi:hypothetical protein
MREVKGKGEKRRFLDRFSLLAFLFLLSHRGK